MMSLLMVMARYDLMMIIIMRMMMLLVMVIVVIMMMVMIVWVRHSQGPRGICP